MIKNLIASLVLYLVCIVCICIYSGVVYFVGHTFWQENAKGSLILDKDKNIRGSFLLAQQLENAKYFSPRTKEKFDSCCDLALYNDKLKDKLLERYTKADNPYDVSLLTPSASLLDPYIMKRDAIKQAIQIAAKRGIKPDNLLRLIEKCSLNNSEPFFELEIVNTTLLNAILAGYYDK
jgi:K+-transporting ATPase c subunit